MLLHCGLCRMDYHNVTDWCRHLVLREHQMWSRYEVLVSRQWREPDRAQILVVQATFKFSQSPQDSCHYYTLQLLGYLHKIRNAVVGDIVWSRKQPRVAILRFPSERLVDKVLKSGTRIQIGIHNVLLRKASNYPDLQWNKLTENFISSLISVQDILRLK